jgi:hypothetical protein
MSKNKSTELDVDFIGGQGSLTKEEETAISQYIRAKERPTSKKVPTKRTTARKKVRV